MPTKEARERSYVRIVAHRMRAIQRRAERRNDEGSPEDARPLVGGLGENTPSREARGAPVGGVWTAPWRAIRARRALAGMAPPSPVGWARSGPHADDQFMRKARAWVANCVLSHIARRTSIRVSINILACGRLGQKYWHHRHG